MKRVNIEESKLGLNINPHAKLESIKYKRELIMNTMHSIVHINNARQNEQQLIQQTQQANQMYKQMMQNEQQNVQMLEQMLQRERMAVQTIQQSLQGHELAIQRCQDVIAQCNQMERELSGQMGTVGLFANQTIGQPFHQIQGTFQQ